MSVKGKRKGSKSFQDIIKVKPRMKNGKREKNIKVKNKIEKDKKREKIEGGKRNREERHEVKLVE